MLKSQRLLVAAAAAVPLLSLLGAGAHAADLAWDADPLTPGIQEGSGTWTTAASAAPLASWSNAVSNFVWSNANADVAVFAAAPGGGSVTLDGNILVGGLRFGTGSTYTLEGGTLTLGLAETLVTATGNGTLRSTVAGSGRALRKAGVGTLELGAANTYTGGTIIDDGPTSNSGTGAIRLGNPAALGTGAVTINKSRDYTPLRFDFGVGTVVNNLALPTGAAAIGTLNLVTTGSTFTGGVLTLKQEAILSGVVSGGSADLRMFLNLSSSQADGGVVFTNPANSFTVSRIQLNRGKVGVGATGALGNPSNLLFLDVTRNGLANAGTGLHFTAPNVTIPNPVSLNDQTVINVNGHEGSVITGGITSGNTGVSAPYSVLGGVTTAGTSSGSLELAGNNDFAHAFEVLGPTRLIVGSGSALGSSFRGTTIAAGATLAVKNGVNYANDDFGNGGEQVVLNGDGVLAAGVPVGALQGIGNSGFSGRLQLGSNASIGVNAGGTLTVAGSLGETGGSDRVLTKIGAGTLVLDTVPTYTGATVVSAGTLRLGTSGDLPATAVQIEPGAVLDVTPKGTYVAPAGLLVRGTGSISGTLQLPADTAIAPGTQGTAGTLTTGSLVLSGGRLRFDLASPGVGGTNDLLQINGSLNVNTPSNVAITPLSGVLAPGNYRLANYTGGLGGISNLQIEGAGAGTTRQTFSLSTATAGQINLVVAGSAASLVWTGGAAGNTWDVIGANNWSNAGASDKFFNLDSVSFTDSGSDTPAVNLVGDLGPNALSVNANTRNYTFAGSGRIVGSTGLTKSGAGTLTVQTANTYTGVTTLNGGVLAINSVADAGLASAIGSAPVAASNLVLNAGTLRYTGPDASTNRAATIGGAVTLDVTASTLSLGGSLVAGANPGSLTKSGAGTLVLRGNASYTGLTTIAGGTLQLGENGDTGSVAGDIVNDGNLAISRSNNVTFTNAISGTGSLQKRGDGEVILTAANSYAGGTTVQAGTLWLGSGTAAGTGPIVVADGAQLNFRLPDGGSMTVANDIQLPSAAGQQFIINNGGPLTQFTRVELTGRLTGGGAGVFRLTDTGFGGNHFSELKLSNVDNSFSGTIELWRGKLIISDDRQLGNPDNDLRHFVENGNGGLQFDGPSVVLNPQRDILMLGSPPAVFLTPGSNVGTVQGVISSEGTSATLTKTGTGTLVLTNANTYTSNTEVQAGMLRLTNTTGSGTGTGAVTVAAAGTIGGTGSVGGTLTSSGRIAPGITAGTFTVAGAVTLNPTAVLDVELASASSFDKLVVNDAAALAGSVAVSLLGTYEPLRTDSFEVLSATALSGSFGGLNPWGLLTVTGGGKAFTLTQSSTAVVLSKYLEVGDVDLSGAVNNQDIAPFVALLTGGRPLAEVSGDPQFAPLVAMVPEPGSLGLLAVGAATLLRRRRRSA
jgi:autotransporter-associated beta strand protein